MSKEDSKNSVDPRERARQIAAKQAKLGARSNKRWMQATIALVVVAIIAIVATIFITTKKNTIEDAGPVPESANKYGGIVLTADGIEKGASDEPTRDIKSLYSATASHQATEGAKETPLPLGVQTPEEAAHNGKPVRVTIFQDYNCVHCAEFEKAYGDEIEKLVKEGKITLEIRNLTFLDGEYAGQYSARTAAAAYAVANQVSPEKFLEYQKEIFSHQGKVMKNAEIIDIAKKYGADIKDDMDNNKWRSLVNVVTPESSNNGVSGTPTVYADGQQYTSNDFTTWINGIIEAKQKSE
ncbi:DsbA family protein [Rothia sp. CCM 9418]|uniref:DsbA family protein n=1 Tax=unclassified Rothia (in: high G+C Gram-positive bacteria) TaxID=2689056 RepID=UPI003ACE5358